MSLHCALEETPRINKKKFIELRRVIQSIMLPGTCGVLQDRCSTNREYNITAKRIGRPIAVIPPVLPSSGVVGGLSDPQEFKPL